MIHKTNKMFTLYVLVTIMVAVGEIVQDGATEPRVQTETRAFGEDVRFDCNTSQTLDQALWRRTTSKKNQVLYTGLSPIIDKDASNIKISPVNYSLFVDSITIDDEGFYVCMQYSKIQAKYHLNVEEPSEVRIQHEGTNLSEIYFAEEGSELQLACVVFGAIEKPVIEWKFGNINLIGDKEGTINSSNKIFDGTFNFRKPLTYIIKHDIDLTCSCYGDNNKSVSVTIATVPSNNQATLSNYYVVLVVLFLLAFSITVLVGGWVCLKRYQGSPLSMIRVSKNERTLPSSGSIEMDSNAQVTPNDSQSKLSRILPDAPKHRLSYVCNNTEEDIYDKVSYNLPTSKVFLRKRICLISRISDGIICERWVGNVTTTAGEKICVLTSRLKDVIHFKHFSWDKLVERLSELPENPHIFKVKGICFDEPHLFLLQDYMACECLVEYLSITTHGTERGYENMSLLVLKLTNISLQVSDGMDFAMNYGLSHPELSMRKILINECGICKLYDFCLTEDASKFVECLKSGPEFLASSHPQECVARNEYTCASDVWYTAFLVQEIYSYGGNQIPRDGKLTHEKSETFSLQPQLCPTIVYERIKECMTPNQNDRPKTVKELLVVLNEVGSTPVSDFFANMEDKHIWKYPSYVPMAEDNGRELHSLPVKFENAIA